MNTRLIALMLAGVLLLTLLCGCTRAEARDLMQDITPKEVPLTEPNGSEGSRVCDYAVRLLQQTVGENVLLSPLSTLYALGMTLNGAEGETRSQMEAVLGFTAGELNGYLHGISAAVSQPTDTKLHLANGIWIKNDSNLVVEQDFLQLNADYYQAALRQTAFDDSTKNEINDFVKENTDGMIPEILDTIPSEAMLYLVNALCFEAKWQDVYLDTQISDRDFTNLDGSVKSVSMMSSTEYTYLEDENTAGFLKYYQGGSYAFAALLPEESISVLDYVNSLTGDKLYALLTDTQNIETHAKLPKFELDFKTELGSALKAMGMTDAFDGDFADFSKLGRCLNGDNLYISRVLHKTHITVDEAGTKAGAATAVEMACGTAMMDPVDTRTVILDRPFVYLIWDCEAEMPLFIGVVDRL